MRLSSCMTYHIHTSTFISSICVPGIAVINKINRNNSKTTMGMSLVPQWSIRSTNNKAATTAMVMTHQFSTLQLTPSTTNPTHTLAWEWHKKHTWPSPAAFSATAQQKGQRSYLFWCCWNQFNCKCTWRQPLTNEEGEKADTLKIPENQLKTTIMHLNFELTLQQGTLPGKQTCKLLCHTLPHSLFLRHGKYPK